MSNSSARYIVSTVLIVALVVLGWYIGKDFDYASRLIQNSGMFGPILAILLYGLLSLTPIPSDPLTVLCGALYGLEWGIFISWMGNNVAAAVEYEASRNVGGMTKLSPKYQKRMPKWLKRWPVDSWWFLIGGRFVPGFGGKVVSVMAGLYHVHAWKYLWSTALANLAGSVFYAAIGWRLAQFF